MKKRESVRKSEKILFKSYKMSTFDYHKQKTQIGLSKYRNHYGHKRYVDSSAGNNLLLNGCKCITQYNPKKKIASGDT